MEKLIDAVIKQILVDVQAGDVTAIEVLLQSVPKESLLAFLTSCGGEEA